MNGSGSGGDTAGTGAGDARLRRRREDRAGGVVSLLALGDGLFFGVDANEPPTASEALKLGAFNLEALKLEVLPPGVHVDLFPNADGLSEEAEAGLEAIRVLAKPRKRWEFERRLRSFETLIHQPSEVFLPLAEALLAECVAAGDLRCELLVRCHVVLHYSYGSFDVDFVAMAEALMVSIRSSGIEECLWLGLGMLVKLYYRCDQHAQMLVAVDEMEGLEVKSELPVTHKLRLKRRVEIMYSYSNVEHSLRRYARVLELDQRCLEIYRLLGDRNSICLCLTTIASLFAEFERYEEALECANQAIVIARELDNPRLIRLALAQLAQALAFLNCLDEAAPLLAEAAAIIRQTGDQRGEIVHESIHGVVAKARGDFAAMVGHCSKAKALARSVGSVSMEVESAKDLSFGLEQLGGAENLRQAIALEREWNHLFAGLSTERLGLAMNVNSARWNLEQLKLTKAFEVERERELLEQLRAYRASNERSKALLSQIELDKREAESLANTDSLTGLFNRRFAESTLVAAWDGACNGGLQLSVALLDVDHFKRVNDTHGHAVGDQVLRCVAKVLTQVTRDSDFCARYGGEEFLVVLLGASPSQLMVACERLRSAIEAFDWSECAPGLALTVSVGAAVFADLKPHSGGREPFEGLIELADVALYRAKAAGRNRVVRG